MAQYAEESKRVKGYPRYEITNKGRVLDTDRHEYLKTGGGGAVPAMVRLVNSEGKAKKFQLSELVAKHFHPNWSRENRRIRHKDGDLTNCKVGNLIPMTNEEFIAWGQSNQKRVSPEDEEGILNWWRDGATYAEIAEFFKYTKGTIGDVVRREKKRLQELEDQRNADSDYE